MIVPLVVLTVSGDNSLTAAESLPQALAFMRDRGEGEYLVFSQKTGRKNFYEVTANGEPILQKVK
jgi:hypothetical protein